MNKFYTLEGYNNIPKKKINPDSPPVYYNDHEVGSWLTAAIPAFSKLSLPSVAALLPNFPPLPSLPPLPPLPPLPSFFPPPIPLPPIPSPVISTPVIKLPIPTITSVVPKIDALIPKINPVSIKVDLPKIDGKIPPPNQWKANPDDVRAVSGSLKIVGDVVQGVGTVVSFIPGGATIGVPTAIAGAGISSVGETGIKIAEAIEKANKLKTGGLIGGLSEISKISGDLGFNKVSEVTGKASNVANQGQQVANAFQSGNPSAVLNTASGFLNSVGVAPSVGNNFSKVASAIDQSLNIVNSNTSILKELSAKPIVNRSFEEQKKPSNTTNKPFMDIWKDPVNDPSHPLYVPPLPSQGTTITNKPSKLPSTSQAIETKKESNNIALLLIGAVGIFILTNKKKGKKK